MCLSVSGEKETPASDKTWAILCRRKMSMNKYESILGIGIRRTRHVAWPATRTYFIDRPRNSSSVARDIMSLVEGISPDLQTN